MNEVERLQAELDSTKAKALTIMEDLFSMIESQKKLIEYKDEVINNLKEAERLKVEISGIKKKQLDLHIESGLKKIRVEVERYFSRIEKDRKKGADVSNQKKQAVATDRRNKIKAYLETNPTPKLNGKSLEYHLMDELNLPKVDIRTIKNDLKFLEKR